MGWLGRKWENRRREMYPDSEPVSERVRRLERENRNVEEENRRLREENERLRRERDET